VALWRGVAQIGKVILLTAEDDIEDTVVPRLIAAGADLSRVEIIKMVCKGDAKRMFSLVSDLPLLRAKIKELGNVVLIVIDPLSAYLGVGQVNTFRNSDVRGVLSPLKDLAEETKLSIIGIQHFNKNTNVTSAMLRLSDSLAFVAASRHAYVVVDEPDGNRRLFTKAKNNLAKRESRALAYTIDVITTGYDREAEEPIFTPRVVWSNKPVNITADQALAAAAEKDRDRTAIKEAEEFLRETLPLSAREVQRQAQDAGIAARTLARAKKNLGVVSKKHGLDGGWMWELPEGCQE
jgi:putative DNA primase/helicase